MVQTSTNPYVIDRPVGKEIPFYGREAEFDWVKQSCLRGERVLILYGSPQIGKTSFLYQLPEELPSDFGVIYIDLQFEIALDDGPPVQRMVQVLAQHLADDGVIAAGVDWNNLTNHTDALVDMLVKVEQVLGDRHLILALDAVETFFVADDREEGLWEMIEQFQRVMSRCEHIHVLWVGNGADRLQGNRPPRFERAAMRRLGSLSMNAATGLVIDPVRDVVSYEPPAVRRIVELASGHPYYIQLICHSIYNDAGESSWTVSLRDVERAVATLLSGHIEEFETVWADSTTSERIVLTALGTIRGTHGVSTRQEVGNALRRENLNVTQEEVTDNLEYLVARGVLERLGAMTYRFRVDLMRAWLQRGKSISEAASVLGSEQRSEDVAARTLRSMVIGGIGLIVIVVIVAVIWWPRSTRSPAVQPGGDPAALAATATKTPTPFVGPTPTSTPHPTPTRPRIRMRSMPTIAYFARADRTQPWQVWVMGSDGKDPVRLTESESNETSPVWSPDGSKFVFVSQRDGNRELYVMDSNGQNQTRLTQHPADDWMPMWAPGGTEIAFVSRRYGNWEIFTIKPNGTDLTRLTETPQFNNWTPAYSPDGQEIVFASNRDGDWELYVMNRDGTMPLRLTEVVGNDFSPAWSPRGDKIVFESTRDGNAEVYVMNADGSEQFNLSRAPLADDHWPCWSPDGSHVAFQSNRDGEWDIYLVTGEGTDMTNITRNRPGSKQGPHWRP